MNKFCHYLLLLIFMMFIFYIGQKITYSLIDKYVYNKNFEDYYKDVKDNKIPIINKIVKTYDGIDKVPEPPLDPERELIPFDFSKLVSKPNVYVTESVTEPVTEPITETVTESVIETVTESVTETVTKSVTESVTESITI